ncbi:MAG: 2-hydroxychromene-2-carboxylate isomerase [Alphaproteobacteria bacterium]|nr:2-hydroxychromene-2-carboxylate isomerase [Alphaproteobacteria bacterium]
MPRLDFWYEFASTYSYPAAMRIEALAEKDNVEIYWRPFLLGPIFADQGWTDSPFNLYPAKGRYMWRDMERVCDACQLAFARPARFPQNGLLGARVALSLNPRERMLFSRALYAAQFAGGRDIADESVVADAIAAAGLVPEPVLENARAPANRAALRAQTEEAKARGIFGAPSFICADGELFWGHDRLEEALVWAATRAGDHVR